MQTTEGEALEATVLTFRLPDRRRAVAALDASAAFERDCDDDDGDYAFLGPEGSGHGGGGRVLLGTLEVGERELVGLVIAASRVRRLRAALEEADAGAFQFVSSEPRDLATMLEAARERLGRGEAADQRDDDLLEHPEIAAQMAQFEDSYYRAWIDSSIPALSGRTPREAARSRSLRPRLIALLKDMEAHSASARRSGRLAYDFSWMWKELDVNP